VATLLQPEGETMKKHLEETIDALNKETKELKEIIHALKAEAAELKEINHTLKAEGVELKLIVGALNSGAAALQNPLNAVAIAEEAADRAEKSAEVAVAASGQSVGES
jgi:peptidoglycan hydrolase CwlO-like protein